VQGRVGVSLTEDSGAMWALVTELLFSLVLLAFLVISCQNVIHIASSSLRAVLAFIHAQLDRELGEVEGLADEEENVTTRVVRRRVFLKGDEAEDLPGGEHVSEEQFTDEHGNIVTKKIVRKVVRRGKGSGEEGVQEVSVEQDANEMEMDAEQFMNYAILGRDSSKPDIVDVKKGAQIVKCASLRRVKQ